MYDFKNMTDDQIEHMIEWLQRAANRILDEKPEEWMDCDLRFYYPERSIIELAHQPNPHVWEKISIKHDHSDGYDAICVSYEIILGGSITYIVTVSRVRFYPDVQTDKVYRVMVHQRHGIEAKPASYDVMETALLEGLMLLKLTWG